MKTKKVLSFVILMALVAAVLVAAPGRSVTRAQDDVFKVAAVAPSATNDLAFSQSMYDALVMVQEEMGEDAFQFDFQDGTFVVDDAAVALREWAASGEYDLIIAHGSQYGAILEELAPEFPSVSFAWGTDVNTFGLDNVFAYSAASEQGGYVNGVIAGTMTESGVIGVIGPIEVGDAKLYVDGFVAGVAAIDPTITVNVNYIQSFSDVPLATEAAETHIANGADILTGSAQMVVGPIAVATENGAVSWFGTQSSQAELSAAAGMSFLIYRWDVVLKDIITKIGTGTLGGEAYTLTLENGGLVMEYTANLDPALLKLGEDTAAGIVAGSIVPLPPVEAAPEVEATEEAPAAEPTEEVTSEAAPTEEATEEAGPTATPGS